MLMLGDPLPPPATPPPVLTPLTPSNKFTNFALLQILQTDTLIRRTFSMCRLVWFRPRLCLDQASEKNTGMFGVFAYGKHNNVMSSVVYNTWPCLETHAFFP